MNITKMESWIETLASCTNTSIILGLYLIVSFICRIYYCLLQKGDIHKQEEMKKKLWHKILKVLDILDKEIMCYSLSVKEKICIRPRFFGDLFGLIPIAQEKIVVNLIKELKRDSKVIDIGAHIGKYTLLASQRASLVLAIEAEPSNFELLNKNIKIDNRTNIKTLNVALSNKKGIIPLYVQKDSSTNTLISNIGTENRVFVHSITLSNLFDSESLDIVDLVKIDIEGAELLALEAKNSNKFLSIVKALVIEVHKDTNFNKIINLLKKYGFDTIKCGKFVVAKNRRHYQKRGYETHEKYKTR